MPKAKKNITNPIKRTNRKNSPAEIFAEETSKSTVENLTGEERLSFINKFPLKFSKLTIAIILIIAVLVIISLNRSWIVAATVNGSPISNLELISRLNNLYRTQTLNQMINEKIITDEARKKGITITGQEIDQRISQLETNVGGAAMLDSLLSQQGQTRISLREQIRLQLIVEKMFSKETAISKEEVNQFIEQNKDQLQASDSAAQTKEAEDILKQQKVGQVFSEKFQELKKQAKIQIF